MADRARGQCAGQAAEREASGRTAPLSRPQLTGNQPKSNLAGVTDRQVRFPEEPTCSRKRPTFDVTEDGVVQIATSGDELRSSA